MPRKPKKRPEKKREKRRARIPARRVPTRRPEATPARRTVRKPEAMPPRKPTRRLEATPPRRTEAIPPRGPERMSAMDKEKQSLRSKLQFIEGELSSASGIISSVESDLNYVEGAMASLPARLSKVRSQGYECMSYLEKSQDLLTTKWSESGPLIKQGFLDSVQPLRGEASRLRNEINRLRSEIEYGSLGSVRSAASSLSFEASSLKTRTASETSKFSTSLREFKSSVSALDRDLRIAETTMGWVSQASFPWKEGESPVLALKAKIMTGDKNEGTLFLTNQRFIFEGTKEVVLKRVLFIATKKKTVRTVLIDQPIGIIQELSKGRVGFLAWAGVYVRFKPDSGLEEIPFDVKGEEVDMTTKFFNYIISGEADADIATVRGEAPRIVPPTVKVLRCPTCSAPYTREVYRGQTSVQCEYCGSVIPVAG
jgi:DNA-directed RNA polymerase subunit RPC12/RpoP